MHTHTVESMGSLAGFIPEGYTFPLRVIFTSVSGAGIVTDPLSGLHFDFATYGKALPFAGLLHESQLFEQASSGISQASVSVHKLLPKTTCPEVYMTSTQP